MSDPKVDDYTLVSRGFKEYEEWSSFRKRTNPKDAYLAGFKKRGELDAEVLKGENVGVYNYKHAVESIQELDTEAK